MLIDSSVINFANGTGKEGASNEARRDVRRLFRATVRVVITIIRMHKMASENRTDIEEIDAAVHMPGRRFITPQCFEENSVIYELGYIQRLFVTFEYQDASLLSQMIFVVIILAILLGVITFILSSDPQYNVSPVTCVRPACDNDAVLCPGETICEPQPPTVFNTIDEICVIIFTIDYMLRILTCFSVPAELAGISIPSNTSTEYRHPYYKAFIHTCLYMVKTSNLIDICAILPFYIALGLPAGASGSSSFVRVLRLARLLRLLKLSKNNRMVKVLTTSLVKSIPGLLFSVSIMGLTTICFAAIMYIIEQGKFTVNADYPDGVYLRPTVLGDVDEISPFRSIAVSIYYTVVSQTTLGYGELVPTSMAGRALACIIAFSGIMVLTLPISIAGTNFSKEYIRYVETLKKEKEASDYAAAVAAGAALSASTKNSAKKNDNDKNDKTNDNDKKLGRRVPVGSFRVHFAGVIDHIPHATGTTTASDAILSDTGIQLGQQGQEPPHDEPHDEPQERTQEILDEKGSPITSEPMLLLPRVETPLEKTLNKIRKVLEQRKEEAPDLTSSRKLRSHLVKKHHRIIEARKMASIPLVAPSRFEYDNGDIKKRVYELPLLGRAFMTLEDSNSCLAGRLLFGIMMSVICLSVACYIMSTIEPKFMKRPGVCDYPVCDHDPRLCPDRMICQPRSLKVFNKIDKATVIIFTIEFFSRLLLCWTVPRRLAGLVSESWDSEEEYLAVEENRLPRTDPEPYPWYRQILRYSTSANSMIDIVAIIPYYIGLGLGHESGVSLSFVRVLRLARVMRLLKLLKRNEYIDVITRTVVSALPALSILIFLVLLAVIFFGSVMFIIEQGTFQVTADFPQGAYLQPTILGDQLQRSPFRSIAVSIYWAVVTTSAVGYGEIVPTSVPGRAIACVTAYFGVMVIALPIGVIYGNFLIEYDRMLVVRKKRVARDVALFIADELAAVGLSAEEEEVVSPYEAIRSFVKCYKKTRLRRLGSRRRFI